MDDTLRRRLRAHAAVNLLLAMGCVAGAASAFAATPAGAPPPLLPGRPVQPAHEKEIHAFLRQQPQLQADGNDQGFTRVDIRVGALDSRIQLTPCSRMEPYLPSGVRLWGRTMIGVRCTEGGRWNVLIPVTVSVWGRAMVAAGPLAAGTVLGVQDAREQEVELSRERMPVVRTSQALEGHTLVRNINAGQPVLENMLKVTPVLAAGDAVRLRISGPGFAIAAQGVALAPAGDGQTVRIRTEQGKVLSGTAREGRIVDVAL